MKWQKLFPTVLIFLFSVVTQAQPTFREINEALEQSSFFGKYREFRNEFEKQTVQITSKVTAVEDYQRINLAYKKVEREYNDLLSLIKADLANYRSVKQMLRNPTLYVEAYSAEYHEVIRVNEEEYLPVYLAVSKKYVSGKTIPPSLIETSIELFQGIVDLIKQRKEMKEEAFNNTMGVINKYFFDKLKMKTWTELGISPPVIESPTPSTSSMITTSSSEITETRPVFENLNGWIEFLYIGKNDLAKPMSFSKENGKVIDVATRTVNQSNVQQDVEKISSQYYHSTEAYENGTQFHLKTYNTGGMYVFALNSGNKVRFLYPYENDQMIDCRVAKSNMKDIDLSALNSTAVVGQDENGITLLPAPDCSTEPPTERYFTISGIAEKENFCILLTRVEINPKELAKQIEAVEGELHERIAKTFGSSMVNAQEGNLDILGHKLSFDANSALQHVLPVVFYINRK